MRPRTYDVATASTVESGYHTIGRAKVAARRLAREEGRAEVQEVMPPESRYDYCVRAEYRREHGRLVTRRPNRRVVAPGDYDD